MGDELRTVFEWETTSAERGAEALARSYDRVGKARDDDNKRAAAATAGPDREAARYLAQRARGLIEVEKLEEASRSRRERAEKESADRVDKYLADSERRRYQSADNSARHRTNALSAEVRAAGARSGGVAGAGHGGGGGHGGGIFGGQQRIIGDMLDQLTGHQGWVMRLGGLNALSHLGAAAVPVAGIGGAAFLAGKEFVGARENIAAAHQATERARAGLTDSLNATRFANAGQGRSELTGQIEEVDKQARAESESRATLLDNRSKNHWSMWRGMGFAAMDRIGSLFGRQTNQEQIEESDRRTSVLSGESTKLRAARDENIEHGTAVARERFSGSEFEARRMEVDMAEKAALAEAQKDRLSEKATANIREQFAIQRQAIDLEEDAQKRGVSLQNRETYIRGRGENVASRAAYARYETAEAAAGAAKGAEKQAETRAAADAAYQEYVEVQRAELVRKETLKTEREIADFRGSAEATMLFSAERQAELAKTRLDYAKQGTDAEREAAQVELSRAQAALDRVNLENARRENSSDAAVASGQVSVDSAVFRVGQSRNVFSPDEGQRFAGEQAIAREQSGANVRQATTAAQAADLNVELEEGANGKASIQTLQAQTMAQQALNRAKLEQEVTDRKLNFEADERSHHLYRQLAATERVTAAMRLQTVGRGDLAGITQGRAESADKAAEFRRTGHADLAVQEEAQQRQRDLQFADGKLLGPDGRRRLPYTVQREEREASRRAARIERFNRRLTHGRESGLRGGSLLSGASTDRLSRAGQAVEGASLEGVSGGNFYDAFNPGLDAQDAWHNQFARKDRQTGDPKAGAAAEHTVTLKEILDVLSQRLPSVTA